MAHSSNCNLNCGLYITSDGKLAFCGDTNRGLACDPNVGDNGCWYVKIGCGLKYDAGDIVINIPTIAGSGAYALLNQTDTYTNADGRVYRNMFCVNIDNTTCTNIFYETNVNYGIGVDPITPQAQIRYGVETSNDGGATWTTLIAHQTDFFSVGWQHKDSYYYRSNGATYPPGFSKQECYRAWLEVLSGTVEWTDSDTDVHFFGLGVGS